MSLTIAIESLQGSSANNQTKVHNTPTRLPKPTADPADFLAGFFLWIIEQPASHQKKQP